MIVEAAVGKGLVRVGKGSLLLDVFGCYLDERLLLVRAGVVGVDLKYQADFILLTRKSAVDVSGSGVRKAADDENPSLLVNVDGLDLDELNLFSKLGLCFCLLDCLPEDSSGVTYIMHAHQLAKLNKVANLVLGAINYHLLYRIVISIQGVITQRLVDAESLLKLTEVRFIGPSEINQIDTIKLLGFLVSRQSLKGAA